MAKETTEIAVKENTVPAMTKEMLAMYGVTPENSGLSDFGAEDITMPWLRIAAKNTDAANEDSKDYIDGLKPGYFFNTLTKQVYGKTLKLIVLRYFKTFAEHTAGKNSEFVRAVPRSEVDKLPQAARQGGQFVLPSGNVIKEQANYLVVLPDYPEAGILRFGLGVGSYKHVKNWNAQMQMTGVIWAGIWEVTTALTTAKSGETYYSIGGDTTNVKLTGYVQPEIVDSVKAAWESAKHFNTEPAEAEVRVVSDNEEEIPY